ncbi:DUF4386 domain-containing protein [Chitinophaga varians]|uniref:DUF4386 domain-containing protein n=1 Tax=Chitinophaga varians TaxID=2202339 RepID=UPI00165F7769|nr:DUF4386 domain-containing protein [Chitinophaga varians]MBC9915643.1 DUF4386 domain-containing protein [Chitinophaga varians]
MKNHSDQLPGRSTTRTAGLLYLAIVIGGIYSILYMPSRLFVDGNAATTVSNITTYGGVFRLSLFCDVVVLLCEVVLSVLLYQLLRHVNRKLAMVASAYRFTMTFIMSINLLNYLIVLMLLSGGAYLAAFTTEQVNGLVMLFIKAHKYGEYIWSIFFALHLLVLGYLIFKSGIFPRIPGILMMVGSLGHLLESFNHFLLPENTMLATVTSVFLLFSSLGELSFAFWLLFRGVKYSSRVKVEMA